MSSRQRLLELNARLAQNLTDKGVEATADETTTALINKVPSVYDKGYEQGLTDGTKEEQEKSVIITENGTTEITPDENKVLSKVTVDVNVPDTSEVIENIIDESGVLEDREATVTEKVEQLVDKASNFTAGFTSEKYKNWLEVNGYTISKFTLTSVATENFDIYHTLKRSANSIVCFRADLDGSVVKDKICFAISADGATTDTLLNRLTMYDNVHLPYIINIKFSSTNYRAILENTTDYIKFRFVTTTSGSAPPLVWESGDYYLAVL